MFPGIQQPGYISDHPSHLKPRLRMSGDKPLLSYIIILNKNQPDAH
jgi:hypothetical protein